MPFGFTRAELHPGLAPRRVGLLGGSFNPPHAGHLHISREAIKRFGLDQVWWLVSPQNPMKPSDVTRPFEERFEECLVLTENDRRIVVSDFEDLLDLQMSADTMQALRASFPETDFVWIMGSDVLAELHLWELAEDFVAQVPLAVFPRPGSVIAGLNSVMARKLAHARYEGPAQSFMDFEAPAWTLVPAAMKDLSSTQLRAERLEAEQRAFDALPRQRGGVVVGGQAPKSEERVKIKSAEDMRDLVLSILEDNKAEDINLVDLAGKSSLADYMIIASGRAAPHVKAMSDHVQRAIKKGGRKTPNVAGQGNGDWILLDLGDVVVHLFRPEVRDFYQLDELWRPELLDQA